MNKQFLTKAPLRPVPGPTAQSRKPGVINYSVSVTLQCDVSLPYGTPREDLEKLLISECRAHGEVIDYQVWPLK